MNTIPFKHKLRDEAKEKRSSIIFDLDLAYPLHEEADQSTMVQSAINVLEEIEDLVAGVMVNRSFGDSVGVLKMDEIIRRFDLPFIADYKLCDIDRNVLWMTSELYEAGFEAVSIPAFIDKEPIQAVKDEFPGQGIILTLSLPHVEKSRFMEKSFEEAAELANEMEVDGVDIAGNHPEDLKRANKLLGNSLVFCSGFEESDLSPGDCLKEEGNFEVIGRTIYESKDPRETAIRLLEEQRGDWDYDV